MTKLRVGDNAGAIESLKRASMDLDELIWTLQSIKVDSLRSAAKALHERLDGAGVFENVGGNYKSSDPNKHFLIGVLPRLFQDKKLFPQNEDIVDFAADVLGLSMSRTQKRSRYEIIGRVVVETDQLSDKRLSLLVKALERLVGDKERLSEMAKKKFEGSFSWNETIQELLSL